jgi:hypothetical protein
MCINLGAISLLIYLHLSLYIYIYVSFSVFFSIYITVALFLCTKRECEPRAWLLRQALNYMSHPAIPFHGFIYFLVRVSDFCPGLTLDDDFPFIAEVTDVCHNTHFICWYGFVNFLPGQAWNFNPSNLCLLLTCMNHHAWSCCIILVFWVLGRCRWEGQIRVKWQSKQALLRACSRARFTVPKEQGQRSHAREMAAQFL